MRKPIYIIFIIIILILAVVAGIMYIKRPNTIPERSISAKSKNTSLFELSPFAPQTKSRVAICEDAAGDLLQSVCAKEYDNVAATDIEKIDDLYGVLEKAKKDASLSDYDRFMVAKLVFATLPKGADTAAFAPEYSSVFAGLNAGIIGEAQAQSAGMSRAQFMSILEADIAEVLDNCPAPGYENWVLNVSCSEHSWINGQDQPIYGKELVASGGPCSGSMAGQSEGTYKIISIIDTKTRSEYDFINESGLSNSMACSFTCGSYNCPKLEEEILNPYCDAKGSQNIYVPHFGYQDAFDIPQSRMKAVAENAEIECEGRSYDFIRKPDGLTSMSKVRDCKILGGGRGEWRKDPPDYEATYYTSYCCSCERRKREPYINIHDFTGPEYKGDDLVRILTEAFRKNPPNSTPGLTIPQVETPTPTPTPTPTAATTLTASPIQTPKVTPTPILTSTPTPLPQISTPTPTPTSTPSQDICCYNSKAKVGEQYYIPFDGSGCLPGDEQVPLDKNCANPLLY